MYVSFHLCFMNIRNRGASRLTVGGANCPVRWERDFNTFKPPANKFLTMPMTPSQQQVNLSVFRSFFQSFKIWCRRQRPLRWRTANDVFYIVQWGSPRAAKAEEESYCGDGVLHRLRVWWDDLGRVQEKFPIFQIKKNKLCVQGKQLTAGTVIGVASPRWTVLQEERG